MNQSVNMVQDTTTIKNTHFRVQTNTSVEETLLRFDARFILSKRRRCYLGIV